jgi:curved DNA-binding protein CbpA
VSPDPNRLPRLVEGLDLRALPISPAEAFVLSRVDGASSEAEIAAATGLEAEQVTLTLARLAELGAVRFETATSERPRPIRSSTPASRVSLRPAVETKVQISERPNATPYDPKELEEPADLEPERKRRILDLFYTLDRLTHYQLLEVDPNADKRAIKARYYEIVNLFHPDRYFGRALGSFKPKLERIFQRVTEAHDVLTRSEARAEYDVYLRQNIGTEALHKILNDEQARARELREIEDRILAEARLGERNDTLRPPTSQRPPPSPVPARGSDPAQGNAQGGDGSRASDPGRPSFAGDSNEVRRRVLARKLGGSLPPPASRATPPVASSAESRERAVQDLKRRYEERLLEARRRKAQEYVTQADADLGRNNLAEAVNALRIATSLLPGDDSLSQRVRELEGRALRDLADRYVAQAEYEEREGRYRDAVRSYTRALEGRPSAKLHERAAHCILAASGDARKAMDHARLAVAEAPNVVEYRITLARAYQAGGLVDSAAAELERAKTLAPGDDTVKNLIRRLQRGA